MARPQTPSRARKFLDRGGGMKTILVPVEQHSLIHSVFETAFSVGSIFGSYIEGMAVSVDLPDVPVMDIAVGVPSVWDPETRQEMAEASRQNFESFFASRGLERHASGVVGPCYGWQGGGAKSDTALGSEARVFDLTVVGRPNSKTNHPRLATVEAALFESGRPVLVSPPVPSKTLGDTVVIAWNGSTETARAVALGMPLLARARRVIVLCIEGWSVPGPTGEQLARSLRANGVPAELRTVESQNGRPGDTILSTAANLGCDLLVKGAYTQSRLRQMIFGGATSTILTSTTLPVLMAH